MAERMGFEPMVRSRESLVFKTSSINHSDTSPQWLPPECRYYYTKIRRGCQPLRANFFENYFAVDLTVNFLLCFVRVVFVLGPSAIRNAKTAAVLHRGGKIFGDYFTAHRGQSRPCPAPGPSCSPVPSVWRQQPQNRRSAPWYRGRRR